MKPAKNQNLERALAKIAKKTGLSVRDVARIILTLEDAIAHLSEDDRAAFLAAMSEIQETLREYPNTPLFVQ